MTVGELRTKMSSLEYSQWATYYYVEQQERNKQRAMAEAEQSKKFRVKTKKLLGGLCQKNKKI